MDRSDTRTAALASFDLAGASFIDHLTAAPEGSLRHLKPGDDYALGGVLFHVNAVLEHYLGVLDALIADGFGDTEATDTAGLFEEANVKAKAGLTAAELPGALALTERLHGGVVARIRSLDPGDFERKAPVRYETAAEPHPTSAADVTGWLTGHYEEHVPHIQQLLDDWRTSR